MRRVAIDTSVLEANASLRSLEDRLTGECYRQYVKRLAAAAGVDTTDPRAVSTFDRKRPGRKTSNAEWQNPHDRDAKVVPDKKGVTRMIYKRSTWSTWRPGRSCAPFSPFCSAYSALERTTPPRIGQIITEYTPLRVVPVRASG